MQKQQCWNCGKQMPPLLQKGGIIPRRSFDLHRIDPKGFFCTLRCGAKYAVKVINAKLERS